MNCIEQAREFRNTFIEGLVNQGFPQEEAVFLTGIWVMHPYLMPYVIRDLGRMTAEQYQAFRETFPGSAESRKWPRASTKTESVPITLASTSEIESLTRLDELDQQYHID